MLQSVCWCVVVCMLRVFVCYLLSWCWQACGKGLDFHAFPSSLKAHQRHSLHNKSMSTVSLPLSRAHRHTDAHTLLLIITKQFWDSGRKCTFFLIRARYLFFISVIHKIHLSYCFTFALLYFVFLSDIAKWLNICNWWIIYFCNDAFWQ